jgi:hypothetical protein
MKKAFVIFADADDVQDQRDAKTIADAFGRARTGFEIVDKDDRRGGLINHLTRTPGVLITSKQIADAGDAFKMAKRYFAKIAAGKSEPASVCPRDEAKAIVQAVDDALEVLGRWQGKFV